MFEDISDRFLTIFQAILGAHGYKAHEHYNPVWTLVRVPEVFLALICPMAEEIVASIEGSTSFCSVHTRLITVLKRTG